MMEYTKEKKKTPFAWLKVNYSKFWQVSKRRVILQGTAKPNIKECKE